MRPNHSLERTGDAEREACLGNSKREFLSNSISKSKTYDVSMMKPCGVSQYEVLPQLSSKPLSRPIDEYIYRSKL